MLPSHRTFEPEKRQLQELNRRLAQYLARTEQLEQENARLVMEITRMRQSGEDGGSGGRQREAAVDQPVLVQTVDGLQICLSTRQESSKKYIYI